MVVFPANWIQHSGSHVVTAYPPDQGARFRYYERLRPCPAFSRIVERILARDPVFRVTELGAAQRLVTHEGEYASWIRIDGVREGVRAVRCIGAVFVEDFASVIESIVMRAQHVTEIVAQSRALLQSETLGMARRPRRFYYAPPPGWQAIASGPSTMWLPPDFPANLTSIVVAPAMPVDHPAKALEQSIEQLGGGLEVLGTGREPFEIHGHGGVLARAHGKRGAQVLLRESALVVIDGFLYQIRLETSRAERIGELRDVFSGVVATMKPLPTATEVRTGVAFATSPTTSAFEHWVS